MKRVLFCLLGLLLLALGLLIEAAIISAIFAIFINEWAVLIITIIVFSIIVGDRIYRYGFKENPKMFED